MADTKLILGIVTFYLIVIALLGLIGADYSETYDIGLSSSTSLTAQISNMFKLLTFSLTELLPAWLNTILFLPLGIILGYEVVARLIRGS